MESTTIEIENNSDISDVPVNIVEHVPNFIDIESFNANTRIFSEWWPITAKIIINGLFSTPDNQRKAAEALMPIVDIFPFVQPAQIRMQNEQLTILYDLLASKLRMYEQYTSIVRERWCEAIRSFVTQARVLNVQLEQNVATLRTRAKFHLTRTNAICNATEKQRCWKAVAQTTSHFRQQLIKNRKNALALLRCHCMEVVITDPPQVQSLECEIERTRNTLRVNYHDEVQKIYQCYSDHLANVQHDAASRVMNICSTDWIRDLKQVARG